MKKQESEQNDRKKRFSCCFVLVFTLVTAAAVVFYLYSGGKTTVEENVSPMLNRVSMVNSTFYSASFKKEEFLIKNELYDIFTNTLMQMQKCNLRMRGFYGESGIGKTSMLKESLKNFRPYPYLLISLTKSTTVQQVAELMNITVESGQARWYDIQFAINQYTSLLDQEGKPCPIIIIIDNANRNLDITDNFIDIIREYTSREVGLLIVSELDIVGDKLWTDELFEPSRDFGVKYLNRLNITDEKTISDILEITGTRPVILEYVFHCITSPGVVDLKRLEKIIYGFVLRKLELLPIKIQSQVRELAKQLLINPNNVTLPDSMSEDTQKIIYRSNILKKRVHKGKPYLMFQNRIVKRYFEN